MNSWLKHVQLFNSFKFVQKAISHRTTVKIRKKSRVPGVMITQYVETLPEGTATPDVTRKPIALTIQEGKENAALVTRAAQPDSHATF